MEAKAQPKKTTVATMQMDQLTTIMNNRPNTKEMITMATIRITMIMAIARSWPISSTKHISKIFMIWATSACQTIQIEDMSIMAPFPNKKKRMRTKNL